MPDDLLRDALNDAAATVTQGGLRPFTAPVRSRRRWAVPVGVVAVATVVAAITLITIRPSAQAPAAPGMTLAAYAGAKYVLSGAIPGGSSISVNDAVTGKQIGQVPTPPGTTGFWNAAGTGDNRTFFLTTVEPKRSRVHFYRLRLRANGAPEHLAELPQATLHGLPGEGPEGMLAATKGGTKLAYVTATGVKATRMNDGSTFTNDARIRERITIIDPASGDRQPIDLPQGTVVDELLWAPDGQHLAFSDETSDGLRILDPATGTIKPIELASGNAVLGGGAIGLDSTQIVALAYSAGKIRLVWYSLATLKITRDVVLGPFRYVPQVGPAVSGNTALMIIGHDLYQVTGTAVHKHHLKQNEDIDMDSGFTW